jgi:Zn finger protein HypA/HybF involved in hydrogenase expression
MSGRLLRRLPLLLLLLAAWPAMAYGISLFKGVMPGKVAEPHAKTEDKCFDCHAALGKSFTAKCVACHKEVGADRQKKRGYHGKTDTERCEVCHAEHKGREFRLVTFDPAVFDHNKTEYRLEGKHRDAPCEKCHIKSKFRETPSTCVACHRKDDYHKGTLGEACEQCHVAASWKEIRFDHARTDFPLEGKHQPVKCEQCHLKGLDAPDTPTACAACHRKEDPHKMVLGERCETCHTAVDWKRSTFNHDKTDYPLVGKHRPVECLACHKTPKLAETPQACYACHKKDDRHKGSLGTQCAECHTAADWKRFRFDHSKTKYPLVAKHQEVACEKCHANERYKNTPTECVACHKKDDDHKGGLGPKCESCHVERGWRQTTFDHDKTEFRLRDAHVKVKCETCHTTPKLEETPTTCNGCHQKDDVHKAKLGERCEQCHDAKTWKRAPKFDHQKSEFPLRGKHEPVACEKCHTTKLFADAPTACVACHKKDDEHKGWFGARCEHCHTDQTWERKDFDHKKEAGYPLDGAHKKVKCLACHTRPLFTTATPTVCGVCHRNDDAHDGALGPRCERCHTAETFAIQR